MSHIMRGNLFRAFCLAFAAAAVLLASGYAAAEKTITLTFTGDVTLGGKNEGRNSPESFDSYAKEKGYDWFFANFREMFMEDDLTVINLEGVLSDKSWNERKKTHTFRGDTTFVEILASSGIDAATLANNHILDYGDQGVKSTKATLDNAGLLWAKDLKYFIYEKDGVKIALFSLQNSVFNMKQAQLKKALAEAREKEGASAVVVCWHTGTEYKGTHNKDTETRVKDLIEWGVDLVIIHHPHVAQGMNVYNNRSVFWSLGNFCFGGNPNIRGGKKSSDPLAISLYAMVVQAKLTFSNDGKYLGQQPVVYPVYTSGANPDYKKGDKPYPENNYQPIRLTKKQAKPVYECLKRDTPEGILPPLTERAGLAEIVFPYMPAFDGVMIPEDSDDDIGLIGLPQASSPKITRENKGKAGN